MKKNKIIGKILVIALLLTCIFVIDKVDALDKPIESLTFINHRVFMNSVNTTTINPTIVPSDTDSELIIGSNNEDVATATITYNNESGKYDVTITAHENGEAKITLSVQDNELNVTLDEIVVLVSSYNPTISDVEIIGKANSRTGGILTFNVTSTDINKLECSITDFECTVNNTNNTIEVTIPENTASGDYELSITGKQIYSYEENETQQNEVLATASTTKSFSVSEYVAVTGITTNPLKTATGLINIPYTFTPENPSITDVTFTSESNIINIIDNEVYASKAGEAVVTITSNDTLDKKNITATIEITVYEPSFDITNKTIAGGYKGEFETLYTDYIGNIEIPTSDINTITNFELYKNNQLYETEEVKYSIVDNVFNIGTSATLPAGEYTAKFIGAYIDNENTIASTELTEITFEVVENIPVSTITSSDIEIEKGENHQIEYTVTENAIYKGVTFISNDESIVTVSETGLVTALAAGETTITIKALDNNEYATNIDVSVIEPTVNYAIENITGDINDVIYETYPVTIEGKIESQLVDDVVITIKNNDNDVTSDFDIEHNETTFTIETKYGTPAGTYEITINGIDEEENVIATGTSTSKSFTINAVENLSEITTTNMTIAVDDEKEITFATTPTIVNSDEIILTVKTGSEEIISIENSKVKGLSKGTGTIIISSKNNLVEQVELTVRVVEPSISLDNPTITGDYVDESIIFAGTTGKISGTITYDEDETTKTELHIYKKGEDTDNEGFDTSSYTSLDDGYEISALNTVEEGTYTIVAVAIFEANNTEIARATATKEFTVEENIYVTEITTEEITIRQDQTSQINYELVGTDNKEPTNPTVTYNGYDTNIITIDNDGTINPVGIGTTEITIKSLDPHGVTGTLIVNVVEPTLSYGITSVSGEYLDNTKIYELFGGTIKGSFTPLCVDKIKISIYKVEEGKDPELSDSLFETPVIDYDKKTFTIDVSETLALAGNYEIVIKGYKEDGTTLLTSGTSENKTFTIEENKTITTINVTKDNIIIGEGNTYQLNPTVEPENAMNKALSYSIKEGNDIITLSDSGLITAVKKGEAEIQISTNDGGGVTKTINVLVVKPTIELGNPTITGDYVDETKIYAGTTGTITGTITFKDATLTEIHVYKQGQTEECNDFDTSNYVSLSGSYEISALESVEAGKYTIEAIAIYKDGNDVVATATATKTIDIEENIYIESIIADDIYLAVNQEKDLTSIYSIKPLEPTNKNVTISIVEQDEEIISINDGILKGIALGNATLRIVAADDNSTMIEIDVQVVETEFSMETEIVGDYDFSDASTETLYEHHGGKIIVDLTKPEETAVTYKIYNSNNELVDSSKYEIVEDGIKVLSTLEAGTYRLVAEAEIDETPIQDYKFFEVVEEVLVEEITSENIVMSVGTSKKVLYEINPINATNNNVTFELCGGNDECIITIDDQEITANEVGQATITIKANDGSNKSKTINVDVYSAETELNITEIEVTGVDIGNNYTFYGSGKLSGSIETTDSNTTPTLKIYKGDEDVTSDFETSITSTSFEVVIKDNSPGGEYTIKINASYVISDVLISSDEKEIEFTVARDIDADDITISMGNTAVLEYTPNSLEVDIAIETEGIITLDDELNITPLKVGTTKVTITSKNDENNSKEITITVYEEMLENLTIDGEEVKIIEDYIIEPISRLNAEDFLNELLSDDYEVIIKDKNDQEKTSGLLATGDKIIKTKNGVTVEYTIIIPGDTSGDGIINYMDYVNVYNHIQKVRHPESSKNLLVGAFLYAGDMTGDYMNNNLNINYLDYVRIYNKIKELKGGNN